MRKKSTPKKNFSRAKRIRRTMRRKSLRRQANIAARRAVNAMTETKNWRNRFNGSLLWSPDNSNFALFNVWRSADFWSAIAQGVGQGQRIGNRIRLTQLMMTFTLFARPTNSAGNPNLPFDVVMYVVSDRLDPYNQNVPGIVAAMASGATGPAFFQDGNSSRGVTNTLVDASMYVNTDRFTLHKKRIFKIANANVANSHNNDYKLSRRFKVNLAKYMPKIVKFNDANGAQIFSRQVFVIFLPVVANNDTSTILPTTSCVGMSVDVNIKFKDL